MNPDALPAAFLRNNRANFPNVADAWIAALPTLLDSLAARWGLRVAAGPFPNLSYNYVAPAVRLSDGAACVLKVGVPREEVRTEIACLRFWKGRGAVRLLDADPERGALLLERLEPGRELSDLADDDEATRQYALVQRRLLRPAPEGNPDRFPHVAEWCAEVHLIREHFDGGTGPFPPDLLDEAIARSRDLLAAPAAPDVLLHGDLHHYNILEARRGAGRLHCGDSERGGWLAIDPKGVIGEPAYEAGALLRNPLDLPDWPDLRRVCARRLDILAETLGEDRERLRSWAVAQAVVSAGWSVAEDEQGDGEDAAVARTLAVAEALRHA